ncbi:MAG: hypothetical protein CVU56_08595 [Deltaproteobacteria bacterium HGW-Deltaproteobacteria-14]|jgi:outer membrane protein OmpA-like peptidoglycan-associated protein|nr:MAG: hypothetical protein CVU56_08595 [Deltaproteobacteria bacterium HGW-Deltaproteobacteria-14]
MSPAGDHPGRRTWRWAAALSLAAASWLAAPRAAVAQDKGFYSEHFEPLPTQGLNLLNLATSRVLGHLELSAGVFLQYLDDPLQVVTDDSAQRVLGRLIERQLKADLWVSMGFANTLELGVVLPLVLNQAGQDLGILSRPGEQVAAAAAGDVRIIGKVKLLSAEDAAGFGLAVLLDLALPSGSEADFTSDGGVRFTPRIVLDWTDADSGFGVVGNLGYQLRPRSAIHNLVIDDALGWGLGVRVPTPLDELKVIASVFGTVPLEDDVVPHTTTPTADGRATPVELDGGVEYAWSDFVVQGGLGTGLSQGVGAPDYRLWLSFGYVPRCDDGDGDSICRRDDACPDAPEDRDGFEDSDGCPDLDNDRDGVPDVADGAPDGTGFGRCRDLPEDQDGFEDADGCPDPDNDQDGVPDLTDGAGDPARPGFGLCRDEPEDKDGYQDADGCPEADNDGDGVADEVDGPAVDAAFPGFGRCRGVDADAPGFEAAKEDIDGWLDGDGCPDPDNDADGVPDVVDGPLYDPDYPGFGVCRDGAGPTEQALRDKGLAPPWRYKDPDTVWPGCHSVPTPRCQCGKLQIPHKINFKYGRWGLTDDSQRVLDEVAQLLIDTPCLTRLRVEGHTDWHGPEGYNEDLSRKRAESVVDYLVGKGLSRARFETAGYGERWPLDPGDAFHDRVCRRCSVGCSCEVGSPRDPDPNEAQVRAQNRRSVFRVLELQDPDGTVKQCKMPYATP